MAQLIMTTSQLKLLIERVTPAVEEWAEDLSKKREDLYTERNNMLKKVERIPPMGEIEQDAVELMVNTNSKRSWWMAKMSYRQAVDTAMWEAQQHARERKYDVMMEFHCKSLDPDHITPVLNYLTALIERLDPEAKIALTDKETFQMKKAMEIAGVNDPRA